MVKVIKYYLNKGNIPSYVITEKNGEKCSGLFPNTDMALLGLGNVTGSESGVTIFNTKAELLEYMESYMQDAKTPVFNYAEATTTWIPLDKASWANWLWSFL